MSTKITVTSDNLDQVNEYLGVNVQELNALTNQALYTNNNEDGVDNKKMQKNTKNVKNDSDPEFDSDSCEDPPQDPLLLDEDSFVPIEERLPPDQPEIHYKDHDQLVAMNSAGECVTNPLIVSTHQINASSDESTQQDATALNALTVASISGMVAVGEAKRDGDDIIEVEPVDKELRSNDDTITNNNDDEKTNSTSEPTQEQTNTTTKLTRSQQQAQQQQQKKGNDGSNTNNDNEDNSDFEAKQQRDVQQHLQSLQVERIIVRKQPVGDWGTYRVDKHGRVINEPNKPKHDGNSITSHTNTHEPSSTNIHNIVDSDSSSHITRPCGGQPSIINTLQATTPLDPKILQRNLEREAKWVDMVANWDHVRESVLKRRVRKGIPSSMRGTVWEKIMALDAARSSHPLRYYYDLLSKPVNDQHELQIRKDLPRLMQDNIAFRSPEAGSRTVMCSGQAMLYNVLRAYSVHDPEVGYVQGMDTVAAPALLYFPEETTFWFLERLLQAPKYKLRELYLDGFPLARRYEYIHEQLVKKYLPHLYKVMDAQGVRHTMYAFRWYTMRYAQFAPELSYRILDIYVFEGDKILYRIALALLMHYEKLLISHPDDMLENLKNIESDHAFHSRDHGDYLINKALKINLVTADIVKIGDQYDKKLAAGELDQY